MSQHSPMISQVLSTAIPCHRAPCLPVDGSCNRIDDLPLLKIRLVLFPKVKLVRLCSCGPKIGEKVLVSLTAWLRDPFAIFCTILPDILVPSMKNVHLCLKILNVKLMVGTMI